MSTADRRQPLLLRTVQLVLHSPERAGGRQDSRPASRRPPGPREGGLGLGGGGGAGLDDGVPGGVVVPAAAGRVGHGRTELSRPTAATGEPPAATTGPRGQGLRLFRRHQPLNCV